MARKSKIIDRDRGYRLLVKRTSRAARGRPHVDVGVMGDEAREPHGEGGPSLAAVASFNEFGFGVPERSFIRAWYDEFLSKNRALVRHTMAQVVAGRMTQQQALELLGQRFQADIQNRIRSGIAPPNAEVTIDRKGSSTPLIDKAQLIGGVTYRTGGTGALA